MYLYILLFKYVLLIIIIIKYSLQIIYSFNFLLSRSVKN